MKTSPLRCFRIRQSTTTFIAAATQPQERRFLFKASRGERSPRGKLLTAFPLPTPRSPPPVYTAGANGRARIHRGCELRRITWPCTQLVFLSALAAPEGECHWFREDAVLLVGRQTSHEFRVSLSGCSLLCVTTSLLPPLVAVHGLSQVPQPQ